MSQSPPDNSDPASESPGDARRVHAVNGSLAVWLALAAALGGLIWWLNRLPTIWPGRSAALTTQLASEKLKSEIPIAKFTDVTERSGIRFVHESGAYGDKLLPETMGGGVAFFDFDGDDDPDLLFINSTFWPWRTPAGDRLPTMALYRNDGSGRFEDVTPGSGLDVSLYGMGVAVGDYDNDGRVDVFITAVGGDRLFRNLGGGKFADVTAGTGVGGTTNDWSTSAGWLDYDNDGDLDLFVCRYVRWSKEIDLGAGFKFDGVTRAYGPPKNFEGAFPALYRNEGHGQFRNVSVSSGIQITNHAGRPLAKSLAVAPVDVDNDGWIDLVVANDTVQNFLFRNQRNGTFQEIGSRSGIAFDAYGMTRGAMGIDAARFRNDDALGVAIGNFANEMNALYVSRRDALIFADEAITEGVGPASQQLLKFGLFFFDYDLDGRLDVLTTNGHLDEEIPMFQPGQEYRQPAQLFWNRGSGRGTGFVPVPVEKCGGDILRPIVGRGSAFADIDGDGDLDVVMTQIGGQPLLLRNDEDLENHWLRIRLIGTKVNRDAIGAWVQIRVGGQTLSRQVSPTRSYLSQSELPVTFGLGAVGTIDEATVVWPGGVAQKLTGLRIDKLNTVTQP
jgi:hypothetical protein